MSTLSFPILPGRVQQMRRLMTLGAALVAVLILSSASWADSCSTVTLSLNSKPIICSIPEQTPEVALTATLTGLTFTAKAQGMVLLYDDSTHTLLSDVVTFTNVGGVATVGFVSDTNGIPITAPGLPILGQFTESNKPIFISVALGNGQFLHAKICSDLAEANCSRASDSIGLSIRNTPVPEPGTLLLVGTGLLSSGGWKLAGRSWGRRALALGKKLRNQEGQPHAA